MNETSNSEIIANKIKNTDMEKAHAIAIALLNEVEKVVIGKHDEILMLITAMIAGGHVLIEDVPGVGKTTLAATLAKAAGLDFKRAQFTPDVMASDITGFNIYNRQNENFEFREGLVMCNILLADEINRASPKTQSSLLEAMEENKVTVDGKTYDIPNPFMVIATQNPTGFVGTYPLPEAQLDRFSIKLSMGYPTPEEEIRIIQNRKEENPVNNIATITNIKLIKAIKNIVQSVYIEPEIYKYIVTLVTATRKHPNLALGASPRASLTLMHMSQAYAFMHNRNYVIPEDIAAIYIQTIAHRVILKQEAKLNRISSYDLLLDVLKKVEVPFKGKNKVL